MPHRDPETGQFVAEDGVTMDFQNHWYDDLEEETVDIQAQVGSGNLTGTNDVLQTTSEYEPVGGLQSGEVAELVAVRLLEHWVWVLPAGSAGTTPGRVVYDVIVGMDGAIEDRVTFDGATNNNVNKNNATRRPGPVVWQSRAVGQQAFNDTVNGTGGQGGSVQFQSASWYSYRDVAGVGPLFDRSDSMAANQSFIADQIDSENLQGRLRLQMLWDIHEVGDRRSELRSSR